MAITCERIGLETRNHSQDDERKRWKNSVSEIGDEWSCGPEKDNQNDAERKLNFKETNGRWRGILVVESCGQGDCQYVQWRFESQSH